MDTISDRSAAKSAFYSTEFSSIASSISLSDISTDNCRFKSDHYSGMCFLPISVFRCLLPMLLGFSSPVRRLWAKVFPMAFLHTILLIPLFLTKIVVAHFNHIRHFNTDFPYPLTSFGHTISSHFLLSTPCSRRSRAKRIIWQKDINPPTERRVTSWKIIQICCPRRHDEK